MNKEDLKRLYSNIILITWLLLISIPYQFLLFFFLMAGGAAFIKTYVSNESIGLLLAILYFTLLFAAAAAVCFLIWSIFVAIIAVVITFIKKDIPFKDAFCKVYKCSVWITFPLILVGWLFVGF